VFAGASCRDARDRPPEIDLLSVLPTAQRRAQGNVDEAVRVDVAGVAGDTRTALVLRAPARVTWPVVLPFHARLASSALLLPGPSGAAQGVTLRVGLSDQRKYTELAQVEVTGSWMPITLDLRDYSEWKFSLFDQPLRKRWHLIVNADATPGGTVALDRPRLTKS
jgi:hypothetical protein